MGVIVTALSARTVPSRCDAGCGRAVRAPLAILDIRSRYTRRERTVLVALPETCPECAERMYPELREEGLGEE